MVCVCKLVCCFRFYQKYGDIMTKRGLSKQTAFKFIMVSAIYDELLNVLQRRFRKPYEFDKDSTHLFIYISGTLNQGKISFIPVMGQAVAKC